MKIFLSYASEDRNLAEQIDLALTGSGYGVFFDRKSLPAGDDYHERIKSAVNRSDLFVFLISPDSVRTGSYALTELKYARNRWRHPKGGVLPVLIRKTPFENIPVYLKGVTILEPEGNVPAEVKAAIPASRKPSRKTVLLLVSLIILGGLSGIAVFVNRSNGLAPAPNASSKLTQYHQTDLRKPPKVAGPETASESQSLDRRSPEPEAGSGSLPVSHSTATQTHPQESAEAQRLQKLRDEKAVEAFRHSSQVDSEINSVATSFENLLKARVQGVDAERDKPLIAEIHGLYGTFDKDAWSWFPLLVKESEFLNLLDQDEIAQAKNLSECYDRALCAGVTPLESYWFLLDCPATRSPAQQLSSLIQQVRTGLKEGSRAREPIVATMTRLLQKSGSRPIPEFPCPFKACPDQARRASAKGSPCAAPDVPFR